MAHAESLTELIDKLQKTKAPLERLRLVGQAWRTLRRLGPEDKADLATRLGIEGAEEIVERLARRQNVHVPLVLLDALRHLKRADPGELRWLIKRLREADERREILSDGFQAASAALGLTTGAAKAETERTAPPRGISPEIVETPPGAAVAPPPAAQPAVAPIVPSARAMSQAIEPTVTKAPALKTATAPIPVVTPAPTPEEPNAASASIAEDNRRERPAPPSPLVERPTIEPESQAAQSVETLLASLRGLSSDMTRTRRMLSGLLRTRDLTLADWRLLIATLSDGWSRRRALKALIEKDALRDPAIALALIRDLAEEWDRFQCLSTLARRGPLGEAGASAMTLLESDYLRKRLTRMLDAEIPARSGG